jgi:hypothetical protein
MVKGLEKLKNKNRLGIPPSKEEASDNLTAPEVAPVADSGEDQLSYTKVDGRTLRKTGRTIQFATRVSKDFDLRLRQIAQKENLLLVQVLEKALKEYEKIISR